MVTTKKCACLFGLISVLGVSPVAQAGFITVDDPASGFKISYDDGQANAISIWGRPAFLAVRSRSRYRITRPALVGRLVGLTPRATKPGDVFKFKIIANADRYLTGFQWSEGGRYSLFSGGAAQLLVTAGGQVVVDDLGSADSSIATFVADLSGFGQDLDWQASVSVLMSDFSMPLKEVEVSLENDLLAAMFGGEVQDVASVTKQDGVLQVSTREAVPVPPTIALLVGGLLALFGIMRQRFSA